MSLPHTETAQWATAGTAPSLPKGDRTVRVRKSPSAAAYIGLSDSKLRKMRMNNEGPRWIVLSDQRIGYLEEDLDDWIDNRPKMPVTAEKKVA